MTANHIQDNCKKEFKYSVRRHSEAKMVPVIMEPDMKDSSRWSGPVAMELGGTLWVDMSDTDFDRTSDGFGRRCDEINGRILGRAIGRQARCSETKAHPCRRLLFLRPWADRFGHSQQPTIVPVCDPSWRRKQIQRRRRGIKIRIKFQTLGSEPRRSTAKNNRKGQEGEDRVAAPRDRTPPKKTHTTHTTQGRTHAFWPRGAWLDTITWITARAGPTSRSPNAV